MRSVAALELPPERQVELAALLDDGGAALEASYPRVAEYLRVAGSLPGTGDPGGDDAFDLRLLHYMTGGQSNTGNPYWDIVAPSVSLSPPERGCRREVNGGSPDGSARLGYAQTLLQAAFAYAIPSPEIVSWVVGMSQSRRIVEIGAGRGYWAHQLARQGVDIAAYDSQPPGSHGRNTWFPPAPGQPHLWHPVGDLRDLVAARRGARQAGDEPGHVLLLCWPPAWGHPMAHRAVTAYEQAGGDRLVYIGEGKGGKSGDDGFFDALAARWELVEQSSHHVTWWNLRDVAQCWIRHR